MVVEVVDPVVVEHGLHAVDLDELVLGAQAVLDDEQRLLPPVPELVEHHPQALRVDLPAPLAGRRVGFGHATHEVALAGDLLAGSAVSHMLM